ncbi:methyl-accepting chemotaxis protein [Brevibacillus dissolubilis]|uniref:methyl-accepting chemotaxis protein n=1 Tax=Brevibacillus dissolubilis TaxID=1844116 RepID=UPI0011171ADE|nr:methyl-accepting chemotaxis protein [Brevibacillus dissolubilis]
MISQTQRFMNVMTFLAIVVSFIVYGLHSFGLLGKDHDVVHSTIAVLLTLGVAPLLLLVTIILHARDSKHPAVPVLTTLALTFASIATTFAGEGMIEYHFSIFMVIAIAASYEDVKMIVLMTLVFAVQHLGSYFLMPTFAFGHEHYSFAMVLVHAVFLILTSSAVIANILVKRRAMGALEAEKEQKQALIDQLIERIRITSSHLTESAEGLASITDVANRSADQIKTATQQVATGSETQVKTAVKTVQAMNEVADGIEQIAKTSSTVADVSLTSARQAQEGNLRVQKAVQQMDSIGRSVSESVAAIQRLDSRSHEIKQILNVISSIAQETNLLALNAAIEAARAGEHGRGFAIVADQVRKLAEQSSASTTQIAELIHQIQEDTGKSVQAMDNVTREVSDGTAAVKDSSQSFHHILLSAERVSNDLQEITAATEEIATSADQVASSVQTMSGIAEDSSRYIQEVSLESNQQARSMDKITSSVRSLTHMARELEDLIQHVASR